MADTDDALPVCSLPVSAAPAPKRAALEPAPVRMIVSNRRDRGSLVTDDEVRLMVAAANLVMPDLAEAWGRTLPTVLFAGDLPAGARPDPEAWSFAMIGQDPSIPGALAYHSDDSDDQPDGFVLTATIMSNGGVPLFSAADPEHGVTVSGALSHELFEAFGDPNCNSWAMDDNGVLHCVELCDAVESNNIVVRVALPGQPAQQVCVSDFLMPAWFDPGAPSTASFNATDTLRAPFTLDKGGYDSVLDPATGGVPQQVFGRSVPRWKRVLKSASGRAGWRRAAAK